MLYILYTYM